MQFKKIYNIRELFPVLKNIFLFVFKTCHLFPGAGINEFCNT